MVKTPSVLPGYMIERPDHLRDLFVFEVGASQKLACLSYCSISLPAFGDISLGRFVWLCRIIRSLISRNADLAAICFYLRLSRLLYLAMGA